MAGLRGKALVAYLLVCTVWGSTYLAIRVGVMHLPPMLFAGVRFVIAGLLLGGIVLATAGDDGPGNPSARPGASDPATVPASFDTQDHAGKGVAVKVPKGWKRTQAGSWVDYTDPADSGRKVRVLVEDGNAEPRRFMSIAENTLANKSKSCVKPYHRISLTDVEFAGRPGAELEYTCGEGPEMRHGVWRETTIDGKMYSFYLTSTDAKFAESRRIFDEIAKTFTVTAAG